MSKLLERCLKKNNIDFISCKGLYTLLNDMKDPVLFVRVDKGKFYVFTKYLNFLDRELQETPCESLDEVLLHFQKNF